MADKEEGEETTARGNEWEVVSLTASAYAAAPGPKEIEQNDDGVKVITTGKKGTETSHAMFMSGHFVFPPSQHENLPLQSHSSEVHKEHGGKDVVPELNVEEESGLDKKDEDWSKGLTLPDEFPGIQVFDEKGNRVSIHGTGFEEEPALQALDLVDREQNVYSASKFSSLHGETTIGGSTTYDEKAGIPDLIENSDQGTDFLAPAPLSPTAAVDDKSDECNLPCEAWWKRRAASLYAHAKDANAFWSIFIAAAVMGLVILGQRWQQERWQVMQLKWQFSLGDGKTGRVLGPIARFKDVIVGGHRRGSMIGGSGSAQR